MAQTPEHLQQFMHQPVGVEVLDMSYGMFVQGLERQALEKHGQSFTEFGDLSEWQGSRKLRDEVKNCYGNAAADALSYLGGEYDLTYVEGYAISGPAGIPLNHAWLVTPDNRVLDATWGNDGRAYFGIKFTDEQLVRLIIATEHYGWLNMTYIREVRETLDELGIIDLEKYEQES